MARRLLLLLTAGIVASVAMVACVGDDPSIGSAPDGDGGPGGGEASTTDSSSGGDSATADGGLDAAADTAADAAAPYEVTSLKGLRMWLESTKKLATVGGGDNSFASWTDSSTKDGGTTHVALPQGVNPPSIVANGFGGRPTLSFVNGNGYLKVSNEGMGTNEPDFAFGLGDFLIVVVAKVTAGGSLWVLRPMATAGSEEQFLTSGLCVSYGFGVTNGCTAPSIPLSTAPHVYVARRKSDIFTVRVDGAISASLDRTASPVDININMFTQPSVFIGDASDMQLSELAIVLGPTPDADLAALEEHLKAKYLIP